MTAQAYTPSPATIARQILSRSDQLPFRKLEPHVTAMTQLPAIIDDGDYETVATVRLGLRCWRGNDAAPIKRDLDTVLAHYRAAKFA